MVVTRDIYRCGWLHTKSSFLDFSKPELELFDGLDQLLSEADSQRGISVRVLGSIAHYLRNIPRGQDGHPVVSRAAALDAQIRQRILTKITGQEHVISGLVGTYEIGGEYSPGQLSELLLSPQAAELSRFSCCLDALQKKAKELATHGYAS